jgi:hypothetical protein
MRNSAATGSSSADGPLPTVTIRNANPARTDKAPVGHYHRRPVSPYPRERRQRIDRNISGEGVIARNR